MDVLILRCQVLSLLVVKEGIPLAFFLHHTNRLLSETQVKDSKMLKDFDVTEEKFEKGLISQGRIIHPKAYNLESKHFDMYEDAVRLMKSKDLKAFDLKEESSRPDSYGSDNFGLGCLLLRRLVERQVRFVEVQLSGWDTHQITFLGYPKGVRFWTRLYHLAR